jgi:hypothetical protein
LTLVLAVLALASFVASCLTVTISPSTAFYMLHTRAFELLIGAILATAKPAPLAGARNDLLGAAGLVLVVAPFFLLTSESPFPGWNAAVPCIGTAMLIHAGAGGSIVSRALSVPVMVAIGLMSYSLYLIHWPVLVLTEYVLFRDLTPVETVATIAVVAGLSWLSVRFVENPVRRSRAIGRRSLFGATAAIGAVLLAAGGAAFATSGFPGRFGDLAEGLQQAAVEEPPGAICFLKEDRSEWGGAACRIDTGPDDTILLWGDSHANQYAPVIKDDIVAGSDVFLYASAGCPPIFGVDIAGRPHCRNNNDLVPRIIAEYGIRTVVMSAYWQRIIEANGLTVDDVAATVARLRALGVTVRVIGDNPDFPFARPAYVAMRLRANGLDDTRYYAPVRNDRAFNVRLADALSGAATVFDPMRVLCRDDGCIVYDAGHLAMADNAHLSDYGATLVVQALPGIFR